MFEKLETSFLNLITDTKFIGTKKPHIIVGLSGGPDSVFLFHFLLNLKNKNLIELSAAHLNHGWRIEAENEAQWCQKISLYNNVRIYVENGQNLTPVITKKTGSQEDLGRQMRHAFFDNLQKTIGADFVALAHHADDQIETFFIRLARGSTTTGLCGMKPRSGNTIRPLLNIHKSQILDYLKTNNIEYLTDPTNFGDHNLRSRIRTHLIPALQQADSRFEHKILTTMSRLNEDAQIVEDSTNQAFKDCFESKNGVLVGSVTKLNEFSLPLQKQVVLKWLILEQAIFEPSDAFLQEILRFLLSPRGGSHDIGQNLTIKKSKETFFLHKTA